MMRPIHTATAQQRPVGRIHNGIHLQRGDITNYNLNLIHNRQYTTFPFYSNTISPEYEMRSRC